MPRCLARNSGSRSAWLPPWSGVFLGSVRSLSEAGHLAASVMPRFRQDSEAVDVDCRQLVGVPQCLVPDLAISLTKWQAEHAREVERGAGRVQLPTALARKYPALETAWGWQWVFPAERDYRDRVDGKHYRHHVNESTVQELLGHNDVRTTMIYAHVLNRGGPLIRSPADGLLGPGLCRPPAAEHAPHPPRPHR